MSGDTTIAITGATGFVGSRVLDLADRPVRALTRRPQPERPGVTWITGDLADQAALARLCDGASAVIHIAGVVNAQDQAGFDFGNVAGTLGVLTAAGSRRFVHVSSLAAREPQLSMYGGSKAAGDKLVQASDADWVIVRPPAVYGPGDREMLALFRLARLGLALAPRGHLSIIHVDDLARALLALADGGPSEVVLELDDGRGAGGGYSHADFGRLIGAAVGRRVRAVVPAPAGVLNGAAMLSRWAARLTDELPKLTPDRARYIAHPDWVARGGNDRLAGLWAPAFDAASGLADTAAWYRANGWL